MVHITVDNFTAYVTFDCSKMVGHKSALYLIKQYEKIYLNFLANFFSIKSYLSQKLLSSQPIVYLYTTELNTLFANISQQIY